MTKLLLSSLRATVFALRCSLPLEAFLLQLFWSVRNPRPQGQNATGTGSAGSWASWAGSLTA